MNLVNKVVKMIDKIIIFGWFIVKRESNENIAGT